MKKQTKRSSHTLKRIALIFSVGLFLTSLVFFCSKPQKFIAPDDWSYYRNTQYGYSIRYPKDWNALSPVKGTGLVSAKQDTDELHLYEPTEGSTPYIIIRTYYPFESRDTFIKKQNLRFDIADKFPGITSSEVKVYHRWVQHAWATVYEGQQGSAPEPKDTFFKRTYYFRLDNTSWEILLGAEGDKKDLAILEQILSTLRLKQ